MNKKILIIPDVHGRTFWESALKSGDYEKIVFLGDYTDPIMNWPVASGMILFLPFPFSAYLPSTIVSSN